MAPGGLEDAGDAGYMLHRKSWVDGVFNTNLNGAGEHIEALPSSKVRVLFSGF